MEGVPILPQLNSILVCGPFPPLCGRPANIGCLVLIQPSVRVARLRFYPSVPDLEERVRVLSHILTSAPHLESFRSLFSPAALGYPGLLTQFSLIRDVTIDSGCDVVDLQDLAKLHNLRRLCLRIDPSLNSSVLVSPSLTHLRVKGAWNDLRGFLQSARVPQLCSLLIFTDMESARLMADLPRLSHIVAAAHAMLERLSVEVNVYVNLSQDLDVLFAAPCSEICLRSIIGPLLSLHVLRSVSLCIEGYTVFYSSEDVRALSEAWPLLEELRLDFSVGSSPCAEIESLAHFARNCPRLRALSLPAMNVVDLLLAAASAPVTPHTNLHEITIQVVNLEGMDEVELIAEVWQFIARLFPKVMRQATVGTGYMMKQVD